MRARVSLFRRFTDTDVCGTGSAKNVENAPQNMRGYTDILQCTGGRWKRAACVGVALTVGPRWKYNYISAVCRAAPWMCYMMSRHCQLGAVGRCWSVGRQVRHVEVTLHCIPMTRRRDDDARCLLYERLTVTIERYGVNGRQCSGTF